MKIQLPPAAGLLPTAGLEAASSAGPGLRAAGPQAAACGAAGPPRCTAVLHGVSSSLAAGSAPQAASAVASAADSAALDAFVRHVVFFAARALQAALAAFFAVPALQKLLELLSLLFKLLLLRKSGCFSILRDHPCLLRCPVQGLRKRQRCIVLPEPLPPPPLLWKETGLEISHRASLGKSREREKFEAATAGECFPD